MNWDLQKRNPGSESQPEQRGPSLLEDQQEEKAQAAAKPDAQSDQKPYEEPPRSLYASVAG